MPRFVALSLVPAVVLSLAACSGGDHQSGGTTPAPTTGPTNTDPAFVVQTGTIIDFDSNKAVAGATVTAGDQSATTDAKGAYTLKVRKGMPFDMIVSAPNYVKLLEQGTVLDANYDRGKTPIVPLDLGTLLHDTLQGYDPSLAVLSVQVVATGGCASEAHTKIKFSPEGSAKIKYFLNKFPSNTVEEVQPGELPSAVIYNLPPGMPVTVTLENESCKQAPFPFTQNGITYEANVKTEAGDVTAFQRLFLQ